MGGAPLPPLSSNLSTSSCSLLTSLLQDLDGDSRLDLVVGSSAGTLSFYWNNSTLEAGSYAVAFRGNGTTVDPFLGWDLGHNSAPSFVDLDKAPLPSVPHRNAGSERGRVARISSHTRHQHLNGNELL